jgi:hypothetical protein
MPVTSSLWSSETGNRIKGTSVPFLLYAPRTMRGIAFFLITLLYSSVAGAAEVSTCEANLSWTAPTKNVDGSDLTDLAGYRLYNGPGTRNYDQVADVPGADTLGVTLTVATGLPTGMRYFAVTAVDGDGNESAFSNEVSKLISPCIAPEAPVMLQTFAPVYTVVKQPDRFILLPIGTVPAGTMCDPSNSVNGHGAVPNDAVIWTSTEPNAPRPIVVVAQCDGG